jgi:hypothetical protein
LATRSPVTPVRQGADPGAPNPGELLSIDVDGLTRVQAEALAIDLSRRSTPTEGGFCTFQPVVDGGACSLETALQGLRQVRHRNGWVDTGGSPKPPCLG